MIWVRRKSREQLSLVDFTNQILLSVCLYAAYFKTLSGMNKLGNRLMKWENATVLDTLRELNSVETVEDVLATFTNFSKGIGFKDYFVSQLTSPSSPQLRRSMTYTNWPDELLAEHADQLQVLRDPVVQYGLRTKFPFRWEQAYKFADKVGMKMAQRVWDFGLTDGVIFPLRPGVPFGAVTLAGDASDILPAEMSELELAVIQPFN